MGVRPFIFAFSFFVAMQFANAQGILNEANACAPLTSRVLYAVNKGDNLAKILKTFKIAPLWCKGCSVKTTAALNHLLNRNLIFIDQKLELPFHCEADLASFQTVPRDLDRFVLRLDEPARPARETASAENDASVDVKPLPIEDSPAATQIVADRASDFRVAGLYGFHSIYATEVSDGSHASLLSTPSYGFEIDWSIPWSDEWRTNVSLGQRFIQFRKASVGTIQDSGNNVGGFSAGVERRWGRRHLHFGLGASQGLAIRATGAQAIVLDPITVPFARVSIEQILHRSGPFELAANLEYRYLGATKADAYDVKSGSAYGGGISVSQQLEKMKIDVRIDFTNEFQNSTIVGHDTKHLEMQIGPTIPLGGGSSSLKAPPR